MKKPDKVFRELGQLYEFGKNLKSFQIKPKAPLEKPAKPKATVTEKRK